MKQIFTALLIIFLCQMQTSAQQDEYLSKVKTLDSTIETLYGVISGDKGVKRDWDLFRFLFVDEAKLIPTRLIEDKPALTFLTPDGYVERSGAWLEENGFFEKEITRKVETFGTITHVFSTYASFRTSQDTEPFARGINSIQLMNDGNRWWILTIYWLNESEEHPIPASYLK